ncbi:MAG: DUF1552 domain-containing protein [Vicinamibacterales bacterium]
MPIITKNHLSRRTVLKGLGVTVALPLLDAMVPAGTAYAKSAAAASTKTRFVAIEQVHGCAGATEFGLANNLWAPAEVGSAFDLSPSSLKPLEPFRDYLTIVSNTDVEGAEAHNAMEIGGDHFRASAVFLTQSHPKQTQGSNVFCGTSLDQMYAHAAGQDSAIPSMQLSIEAVDQAGGCAYGYSCVYTDTVSWASPTQPLPMIQDPRAAFDQLFGVGTTAKDRAAKRRTDSSILDSITSEVTALTRKLSQGDKQRLSHYLNDVREIERRIQNIEAHNSSGEAREIPEAPIGVPDSYAEHVKLMFDLQVAAFAGDVTRVFSFKTGRDGSSRAYPESGITGGFHPMSHHGDRPDRIVEFSKINTYHVSLVPYFLEKMKNTADGEANLLENSLIIYGSPMGDPHPHNHKRCPLFIVGHAGGKLKGNLHLRAPAGTPMANPMLSMAHILGLDVPSFGNSTGTFDLNSVASSTLAASKG